MDKIVIERLQVFCNHGVFEDEKINGQNFYVSVELGVDCTTAGKTDNLVDSVNYASICHMINDYMKDNTFDLIETVAHNLSVMILDYSELINTVKIRIDKPEAPVGLPFGTVAVEIERGWHRAYVAFGSNMGDSEEIICNGISEIANTPGIRVVKTSSIISTKPYGGVVQDDFLNGCMEIRTRLNPNELLEELHRIENNAGRTREIHWGPRTLDLDILLYDELVMHTEELTIPHVDMANRSFVLEPMCEIAPYAYNPVTGLTMEQMYEKIKV